MKNQVIKKSGFIVLCFLFFSNFYAQENIGRFSLDLSYGFPNVAYHSREDIYYYWITFQTSKNYGISALELKGEYMLDDKFGIGFYGLYSMSYVNFYISADYFVYDFGYYPNHHYEITTHLFQLLFKMQYHFINKKKLDFYGAINGGYERIIRITESDAPHYDAYKEIRSDYIWGSMLYPWTIRLNVGFRYYPFRRLGFNAEIGLGGSVLSGGISYRFFKENAW